MDKRAVQLASAGVAAALIGFAATYALTVTTGALFLPELSTQFAIEMSPGSVSSYVIEHLGKAGKISATVFAFLVYFVVAAVLALLFDRLRPRLPGRNAFEIGLAFSTVPLAASALLLAIIGWLAPATLAKDAFGASAFSVIVLNVCFGLSLAVLADTSTSAAKTIERRPFLFAAGAAASAAAFTFLVNRTLYDRLLHAIGAPGGKLPSFITPNADFYQVSMDVRSPAISLSQWRLSVTGEVDRPLQLSYADLMQIPTIDKVITLECVSNEVGGPLISNARWRGAPLSAVLRRAGMRSDVREIVLQAADGYSDSIPVELALSDDTMLALFMNGVDLPREHGFPVRLLAPGLFGMENVKWLIGIQAISGEYRGGYWQTRGWTKFAVVKTMSKISVPSAGAEVSMREPIQVGGVAFAGTRGIDKVEVAISSEKEAGAGMWMPAQLQPEGSNKTWRLWQYDWRPDRPGVYRLVVRATDGTGALQIAESAPISPNGSTGYHTLKVRVKG